MCKGLLRHQLLQQQTLLTIPELGLHFDNVVGAQDEIGDNIYPALVLGEDGCVKTALQEKVFAAWLAAAQACGGQARSPLTRSGDAAGRQRGRRYVPRGRQAAVRS